MSAEKLHALTRTQFEATAHDKTHRFEGTDLREVLRAAGMDAPAQTRGALLRRVITAHAADGYIVAFTWAEIDPSIGGKKVYLVDRQEGAVLGPDEGPLRLVVPAESRPARWARQVIGLVISDAP